MTPLAKKVAELFGKPELVAEERSKQEAASSWPCPHCGREATIEAVEPSLDGERLLTFWHCEPCQVWAVTPSGVKAPPAGWVSSREQ